MTPAKRPSTRARQTPIQSLDDLQPDPLNANRGTDRGREALRRSLYTYGAGRSIVIDKRGRILGGHKTVEQAKHLGLPITVVPTTGETLVVVQRVDLDARTDPRAQELALADNRVGELDLDWDPAILQQLQADGLDLGLFWTTEEFERLLGEGTHAGQTDENAVVTPGATDIVRGDLFALGRHRLGSSAAGTILACAAARRRRLTRVMENETDCINYLRPSNPLQRLPPVAGGPVTTASRSESHRTVGLDTVRHRVWYVTVDLADVERALDHRRARCEERTPVATEGERFRRARGATIPAKSAAKLTPRPRDTRVSVLSFRSYWARSMPLMWVQCRSARSPSCSWDRPCAVLSLRTCRPSARRTPSTTEHRGWNGWTRP